MNKYCLFWNHQLHKYQIVSGITFSFYEKYDKIFTIINIFDFKEEAQIFLSDLENIISIHEE